MPQKRKLYAFLKPIQLCFSVFYFHKLPVIRCGELSAPSRGSVVCTNQDAYSSECTFKCEVRPCSQYRQLCSVKANVSAMIINITFMPVCRRVMNYLEARCEIVQQIIPGRVVLFRVYVSEQFLKWIMPNTEQG